MTIVALRSTVPVFGATTNCRTPDDPVVEPGESVIHEGRPDGRKEQLLATAETLIESVWPAAGMVLETGLIESTQFGSDWHSCEPTQGRLPM
jgi:hypothetical protein